MYSDDGCQCSHWQGFPIRTSPDHSLLATPRSLSQLTTSFIAYLRQGIHTHALSSLTIKSILNTDVHSFCALHLLVVNARQYSIVKDHETRISDFRCRISGAVRCTTRNPKSDIRNLFLVGLGRIELPTSPLSGVRSSQLSYRPDGLLVELVGIEPATS